jgi:hypothetical protein
LLRFIHKFGTKLFDNLLTALHKCEHLESFTWTEQAHRLHVTGASLSWPDVQCVCAMFPIIEDLYVLIFMNDIVSLPHRDHWFSVIESSVQTLINEAILEAKNLRTPQ